MYEIRIKINVYDGDDNLLPVARRIYSDSLNLDTLRRFLNELGQIAKKNGVRMLESEAIEYKEVENA